MEEQKTNESQLLLLAKIQTALLGAVLALLLIGGIFAGVQLNRAMQIFKGVDTEQLNGLILSLQNTAADLENLDMDSVAKTVEALQSAAKNLADVDMDAVNDGILALSDAAENLQGLDIEKLNDLITSLEKTATQMEKTSAAFGKLFGK